MIFCDEGSYINHIVEENTTPKTNNKNTMPKTNNKNTMPKTNNKVTVISMDGTEEYYYVSCISIAKLRSLIIERLGLNASLKRAYKNYFNDSFLIELYNDSMPLHNSMKTKKNAEYYMIIVPYYQMYNDFTYRSISPNSETGVALRIAEVDETKVFNPLTNKCVQVEDMSSDDIALVISAFNKGRRKQSLEKWLCDYSTKLSFNDQ